MNNWNAMERIDESNPRRILIVAGGTGGHIAPALAMGDYLRREFDGKVVVRYLTGSRSTERQVFEAAEEFPDVLACDRPPTLSLGSAMQLARYGKSVFESMRLLKRFRPHAILATGGYVCAPVLLAARMFSVPIYLHESNAIPGQVTRLFARKAQYVFTAHEAAAERLGYKVSCWTTGTPVRRELLACTRDGAIERLGLSARSMTMLVLGGSQGARGLNEALVDALPHIARRIDESQRVDIIWACGPLNLQTVARQIEMLPLGNVHVHLFDYLREIQYAYAASDLVISRAGASTLAEITALGLPSILVPYPYAKDNHQVENARSMVQSGASLMLEEHDMASHKLAGAIAELLLSPARRDAMGAAARQLASPACMQIIANELMATSPISETTPDETTADEDTENFSADKLTA